MGKRLDLTGQKFNLLMSIRFDYIDKDGHALWLFKCDCGTEKVLRASTVKSGNIKSCSCISKEYENLVDQIFYKLLVKSFLEIKNNNTYWSCICECGKTKIVTSNNLKSGHTKSCGCYRKFCSYEKMKTRNKENNICGKNNPNWNPNLTNEDRENSRIRNHNPKHKIWHKKVFTRDDYTCQCCKQRGGKLAAHHIYSFHSHKHLRYVTSNGVTLCVKCHRKFHKEYGIKNNTRKQFNKFKNNRNT